MRLEASDAAEVGSLKSTRSPIACLPVKGFEPYNRVLTLNMHTTPEAKCWFNLKAYCLEQCNFDNRVFADRHAVYIKGQWNINVSQTEKPNLALEARISSK